MPNAPESGLDRADRTVTPRARRLAHAVAVLLPLLASAPSAWAHDPPVNASASRHRVVLRASGKAESVTRWSASFRELLGRLGIDVAVDEADPSPPPLAVVTVDLSRDDEVVVEVVEGKSGRQQARRTLKGDASSPLTLEAAAHVAQFAVEDLLEVEVGAPPSPAEPHPLPITAPPAPQEKAPEAPATAPEEGNVALDVSAFAVGSRFSEEGALAFGGGAALGSRLTHVTGMPTLWLSAAYRAPIEVDESILRLRVSSLALRLIPTLTFSRPSWAVEAGAGGGADLLFSSTDSAAIPTSYLTSRHTDVSPVFGAVFTGHIAVARTAAVTLSLMLDVDLAPRRYVSRVAGDETSLLLPARLRPALAIGFAFSAFGRSRFASGGAR